MYFKGHQLQGVKFAHASELPLSYAKVSIQDNDKFGNLQLWCPLRYKDMFYLFENFQSISVWSQTAKGVVVFQRSVRSFLIVEVYLIGYYTRLISYEHHCTCTRLYPSKKFLKQQCLYYDYSTMCSSFTVS